MADWPLRKSAFILFLALACITSFLQTDSPGARAAGGAAGTMATFAGGGAGDSGAATSATLHGPAGLATDSSGNLYIADYWGCRIRKASTGGMISTVAGNGACGYSGDGAAATSASLSYPSGVAIDAAGVLYIADTSNCRVRRVDSGGTIETIAGTGVCGFSLNGVPAVSAPLDRPSDVAVEPSGALLIADAGTCRIRRVDTSGVIGTVAGSGFYQCSYSGDGGPATSAKLSNPEGLALSATGEIYIADSGNCRVRKVDAGGMISTVAGNGVCGYAGDGGTATAASINYTAGVAVDASGDLYIADFVNCRLRAVSGGTIDTVAGDGYCTSSGDGGPASISRVDKPYRLTFDASGELFVAELGSSCRVRNVDTSNSTSTFVGNGSCGFYGDGGPAASASLHDPWGIAVDASRNLYIADYDNCRVRKVRRGSGKITTVAGDGACIFAGDGGSALDASLPYPIAVAVPANGDLYIGEASCRVRKVDASSGEISTVAGNGSCAYSGDNGLGTNASIYLPFGLTLDGAGNLYIADYGNCRVRKVDGAGIISTVAGTGTCGFSNDSGLAVAEPLGYVFGVALDSAGNLYIADGGNCRVRKVDTAGMISTVAGNGTCSFSGEGGPATAASLDPHSVGLDAAGTLHIADARNCRVYRVVAGIISTIAGNGACGFSGDGGAATGASLTPAGVALDSLDNLFISDGPAQRVRVVHSGVKPPPDADDDGCPDAKEQQATPGSQLAGGLRDYLNPHDYFNPTHDGLNRVDDIVEVVNQYFVDDDDANPGLPPYEPGYNPDTDRTQLGPDAWDTGPPNGVQRIDDVVYQLSQYFHDCS